MLRKMISNGHFLRRRGIVRELSFFVVCCRRFFLRACEKRMLSLHLSESLKWKCRSAAQSVGFLYRIVESLRLGSSCLGRISLRWSVQK